MTMSHKEALETAQGAYVRAKYQGYRGLDDSPLEAAIRAYLNALGWVMVPKEPTDEMYEAARHSEGFEYYHDMLAAAPDPFQEDSE